MKRYELSFKITDERYIDSLIVSLVRQGYEVYYNPDEEKHGVVCAIIEETSLIESKSN